MNRLRFCLNDRWLELEGVSPTTTLLRYLRDQACLTGTKEGCAEGDCGACTVVLAEHSAQGAPTYRAINSCLLLLPMLQGKQVYTVEGIKQSGGALHAVQRALAERLGSQCGYCTPGVVMAMFEACYRSDLDTPEKLDAQMCGNLCRCTGYRPIREATESIAGLRPSDAFTQKLEKLQPPDMALQYRAGTQQYFNPVTAEELWALLEAHPDARFINGGTDLSLEVTKRYAEPPLLVSLEGLSSLKALVHEPSRGIYRLGAAVSLTDLEDFARVHLPPLAKMLHYFGARAIKSRATVGGNLCTASPIGDLAPVFLAYAATAVLLSREGERRVPLDEFFVGYRKTALKPREVLAAIELPEPGPSTLVDTYKVSKRRELDISTVSAALRVELSEDGTVRDARFAFGGMAATPARAGKAEAALVGAPWSAQSMKRAAEALAADFRPVSDHRGSAQYRALVAKNLLLGFYEDHQAAGGQSHAQA